MPTIPSVFRNIRKNDVHQRPFKAYKNYTVGNDEFAGRKYELQKAVHKKITPHVGDATYNYPINSTDDTNQHVVWNWIDHRYYRHAYDQARCHELTDIMKTEKFLNWNSSVVTIPYHEMGERVKPGSLILQSCVTGSDTNLSNQTFRVTGSDDGLGNLRDLTIPTTHIPSASNNLFYLTFNNEFRRFDDNYGLIDNNHISYKLRKLNKKAEIKNVEIVPGVSTVVSGGGATGVYAPSGLAGKFSTTNDYIKIPHDKTFDEFQRCDDWGISFWFNPLEPNSPKAGVLISKYTSVTETFYDQRAGMQKVRDINKPTPSPLELDKNRTPFHIVHKDAQIHYIASDGTSQLHISASVKPALLMNGWAHVFIRNGENQCKIYVNGVAGGTSGSISRDSTANYANVLIGTDSIADNTNSYGGELAEIRTFSYALNDLEITTLANNDFYTGSLYQTNVFGNVFYRNGQVVVTSPMPKYQDMLFTGSNALSASFAPGSAASGLPNRFELKYKGQYTIYENEVMVRIPMGSFNVSTNPTATYRPATGIDNSCNAVGAGAETFNGPGDFRKTMFITGSAKPYITTVGLFNDKGQMLAVGKLAEPLENRDDIDMNIIVRWDY